MGGDRLSKIAPMTMLILARLCLHDFAQTVTATESLTAPFPDRFTPLHCKAVSEPHRWPGFSAAGIQLPANRADRLKEDARLSWLSAKGRGARNHASPARFVD